MSIKLNRVYEKAEAADGYRVLIDRLWPRGLKKEAAAIDVWLKDIAPSPELRSWFGHDPKKFHEFSKLYSAELKNNPAVAELRALAKQHKTLTLLYGARDAKHNHALVLQAYLKN